MNNRHNYTRQLIRVSQYENGRGRGLLVSTLLAFLLSLSVAFFFTGAKLKKDLKHSKNPYRASSLSVYAGMFLN